MANNSIKSTIQDLEDLFEVLNSKYFNGELKKPIITVAPDNTKHGSYGWCTNYEAWKDSEEGYFEINICAEYLTRPFTEVAGTMLHEMVHLYNTINGVKDCSRGGTYHNKKFKDAAETHGLNVEESAKYGWSITCLNKDAINEVEDFMGFIGKQSFDIHREVLPKEKKKGGKSSSRKYVCPVCGTIVRATKEVKIICADCDVMMVEE